MIDFVALGLKEPAKYRMVEVFGEPGGTPFVKPNCCASSVRTLEFTQKRHSVRVLKLIDESVPPVDPESIYAPRRAPKPAKASPSVHPPHPAQRPCSPATGISATGRARTA